MKKIITFQIIAVVISSSIVGHAASGSDRLADFEKLVAAFEAAQKQFFDAREQVEPTIADQIRSYEAWPGWQFVPRFVELAEAQPADDTALRCCQWIIDHVGNVGNQDQRIFEADQRAWEILAAHHTEREELPMLCMQAVQYHGPAQERFLRELLKRKDLSHLTYKKPSHPLPASSFTPRRERW